MYKTRKGKYSPVWNFFEMIDRNCAKCLICNGIFSYRSTLSNLRKHLDRRHTAIQAKVDSTEGPVYVSPQTQIFQISDSALKNYQEAGSPHIEIKLIPTKQVNETTQKFTTLPPDSKKFKRERRPTNNDSDSNINDALMQLFIADLHPITIIEDEGFKSLVKKLNPAYEIPSRKYISQTLLPSLYEKCLENVKELMKTIKSVCVTTECWTSNSDESFLAVTVHFLDSEFFLQSVLISCSMLEENFTSESLAEEINRIICEWELQNKVIFSVSSGEDYMANAIKQNLKWNHFGCFAFAINKIIGDALNLKPVDDLLTKVRQLISFFRNDPIASSELQLSQINCNMEPKKLKQDIPMLWNSTFYMIERFVELEGAISCTVTMQESNSPLLQPDEWIVLKELTKILRSLEAVTKASDQKNYMLASLPIVLANGLFEICRKLECCLDTSETTKQFVFKLKTGLNSKFSELSKNWTLSICTFLDPRFKTILFGDREGIMKKRIIDLVTKKLNSNEKQFEKHGTSTESQSIEELSVWEVFDKTAANTKPLAPANSRIKLEVDRYIEDDLINRSSDPLEWWRFHRYNYPLLSEVVNEIFCSLATSVPCNRLFTKAGSIFVDRRVRLSSCKLKQLVFLNANYKLFSK